MTEAATTIVNLDTVPLRDHRHGEGYAAKIGRIGPLVGLTELGIALHVVAPGKRAYPLHRHHVIHEAFVVLSGVGEYRLGEEVHPVRAGDVIGAPAGGAAHQLVNTGTEDLRYLGLSTIGEVDVVEYPDTGKMAVAAGIKNADFRTASFAFVGRGTPAGYWDGEA